MNLLRRCLRVFTYIIGHNPWYMIPRRILWSLTGLFYLHIRDTLSVRLFNGKRLILFTGNAVSSEFLYTDIPDREEIMFLRSRATQDTVFLDIGANIGSYSICLLDKVKSVIAFEPSPQMAAQCRKNFLLNNVPVKKIEQAAVSSVDGFVRFTVDQGETQNHVSLSKKNTITVPSLTLDRYMKKKKLSKKTRYLVKIDVEGAECDVLSKAHRFLREYTVSAIVYESFGKKADRMKHMLEKEGFTVRPLSEHNYSALRN